MVKVVASLTVATKPVVVIAGLVTPETPLSVTVLPLVKPCGCAVTIVVEAPAPGVMLVMSV